MSSNPPARPSVEDGGAIEADALRARVAVLEAENAGLRGGPSSPDAWAVFEAMSGPCMLLAPDVSTFTIVGVNDAYLRATMTQREKMLGRPLFEVFPDNPDDPDATGVRNLRASLMRVLAARAPDRMALQKYDIQRPESANGGFEERWWLPVNAPLLSPSGTITCIIHNAEDVTERVRAEHDVHVHRELLEAALSQLDVGAALLRGTDLRYLIINQAYQAIGPHKQILGKTIYEAFPETQPGFGERCRSVLETGEPYKSEDEAFEISRAIGGDLEGAYFTWSIHRVQLPNEDGPGLLISAWDTTGRKQVEADLRDSEERLRTLADNIPLLCWMANPDGGIFWYNHRWYEYTDTTPEQMEGWGWQSVHDPDALPGVLAGWKRAIAAGEPFEMVFPLKGADGTFSPFLTRAVPIRDEAERITRWFGTNTEVRDIIDAREALARSRAELERLVEERTAALLRETEERRRAEEALRQGEKLQAIGQLTGGIAHDFNNIMQVVISGASLLRLPKVSDAHRTMILDGMTKAAKNAKDLTDRLLAFARKQTLQPEAFDLNTRLSSMSDLLRHTLGSRIVVKTDLADDLTLAMADPSQLEVAVLNLAMNARDAMLPDGGTLTLQSRNVRLDATSERAAGDYVCLAIKDTGQGMSPAVMARVFEPFFTTKGPEKGTGLGLAQAHGFAKQSGGDIAIESIPGQGTTIILHLPRATEAMQKNVPARLETAGAVIQRTAGKTVLVVDDNADVATFAASMLESLGYSTRTASTAAAALALIDAGDAVDAVFSDVVMPGQMNGVQLANLLRLRYPHLALVLATGYSEMLADGSNRTVAEVLGKPYRLDELAVALDRAFAAVGPAERQGLSAVAEGA